MARTYTRHPQYDAYYKMLSRCYRPTAKDYGRYGGRGITVCDRWRFGENGKSGFQCYLHDIGEKPSQRHSLDRIDNSGAYDPSNIRWATPIEQAQNRRYRPAAPNMPLEEIERVRGALLAACVAAGGQSAWGRSHGVSGRQISSILRAERRPTPKVLSALGFQDFTP